MSSSSATVVRVPKARTPPTPVAPRSSQGTIGAPRGSTGTNDDTAAGLEGPSWLSNEAGVERSFRVFFFGFLVLPSLIVLVFTATILTSSYAGVRDSALSLLGPLAVVLAAIILIGFLFTLARTPRGFRTGDANELRVIPLIGDEYGIPLSAGAYQFLVEYYPLGIWGRRSSELIQVHAPPLRSRRWVVGEGLLDPVLPRKKSPPPKPVPRGPSAEEEAPRVVRAREEDLPEEGQEAAGTT